MEKPKPKAQEGDIIRIRCMGQTSGGKVFDMARSGDALEIIIGHGDLLGAVERAFIGMTPGESKQLFLSMDEAYGPRREDLVQTVDRDYFPLGVTPRVGLTVKVPSVGYDALTTTIVQVTDTHLVLDGNHPLAGEDVMFILTLLEIVEL